MSQGPRTNFTTLTESEKKSKLWQLAKALGKCSLWRRGEKERQTFRIKEYLRDENRLIFHSETNSLQVGQDVLGSFELSGVSFFFKTKMTAMNSDTIILDTSGEFYKSERRQNFRLLAYPIYDITASFNLPVSYEGGKVVDIRNKASQTGLFKSFLKLVDSSRNEETHNSLRLRVQDLSVTGMSVHIGPAEIEWFRTGESVENVDITLPSDKIVIPKCRIVYVVDQIGHGDRLLKKYKVGIRFESLTEEKELKLAGIINGLLRTIDANSDFEDFLK